MKTIILETAVHRNEQRLLLRFDYDVSLIEKVKKLEDAFWSQSKRCWHIPVDSVSLDDLRTKFPDVRFEHRNTSNSITLNITNKTRHEDEEFDIPVYIDERKNIFYCAIPFELKDQFKKLEGSWWHPGARTWSAINSKDNLEELRKIAHSGSYTLSFVNKELNPNSTMPTRGIKQKAPVVVPDSRFERLMLLQNKKESTIRQYKSFVSWFLSEIGEAHPNECSVEHIQKFIHEKVIKQRFGLSQQNGVISALKLYYLAVYDMELNTDDIPRPKRERPLPKVISEEEFLSMLSVTQNQKHKLILMLLYGCGLRRGELCQLKIDDIDFDRGMIFIKGKGNKYRPVNPGTKLLKLIEEYIKSYLPDLYLIESPDRQAYSGSSVGAIVKRAARQAGITRRVHAHMLRHSFATHHMEKGIELRLIQETLGHASSKTTEIYTYVSQKSIKRMPNLLDDLKI